MVKMLHFDDVLYKVELTVVKLMETEFMTDGGYGMVCLESIIDAWIMLSVSFFFLSFSSIPCFSIFLHKMY